MNDAPIETLQFLIEKYPEGVSATTEDGWLPLHFSCVHGAPSARIEFLLDCFPGGVLAANEDGDLPLHLALSEAASCKLDNARLLVERAPRSGQVLNHKGMAPLHVALMNGCSGAAELLLERNPEAARVADESGRLPLHYACRGGASFETIQRLLALHPEAASKPGPLGKLPLHEALSSADPPPRREKPLIFFWIFIQRVYVVSISREIRLYMRLPVAGPPYRV